MSIMAKGARYFKRATQRQIKLIKYRVYDTIYSRQKPLGEVSPEAIGLEMKRLAEIFDYHPIYFDTLRFKHKYMFPFVAQTVEFLVNHVPKKAKILDIAGGPGNLGLALVQHGFSKYLLADIDDIRMRWGALLWQKFGHKLHWQQENALSMSFEDEAFDVVALLGWENPQTPYSYTLKECARLLKPEGILIFTYHDIDGIIEGNWDFDPARRSSYLGYSISRQAIRVLCQRLGLTIIEEKSSGHSPVVKEFFPDEKERVFPQYILFCKKEKIGNDGK